MRTLFSICALLLFSACSAHAGASRLIEMKVIERQHGQAHATYYQSGKRYVAGNPGERYAIRLSNRSGERVLAVLSVDGVNVISGETAGTQQSGYVLAPHASVEISGWRKSESEVAQFYFTTLADSYAARTGRPEHVGVIGVAAFREKNQPPPIAIAPEAQYQEQDARGAAGSMGALADSAPSPLSKRERLGTGHGAREYAPATSV